MAGYRFCRTDDIPLLVDSYNRCYVPYADDAARITPEDFKRQMRELDLWASSCMLATAGERPVGVMLATKRDGETLIHSLGVLADHRRRGHGAHMLDSLRQKLAILGPPRLIAEIPDDWPTARAFFERCGFVWEGRYADFVLDGRPRQVDAGPLLARVSREELLEQGALDSGIRRSWQRSLPTLAHRDAQLGGLAMATDRLEAYLLHRDEPLDGSRQLVALGAAPGGQSHELLGILIHHLARHGDTPVVVPRIAPEELDYAALESWGFRRVRDYGRYAAQAGPGQRAPEGGSLESNR